MKPNPKQRISVARSMAVEVLRKIEAEGAYSSLVLRHALEKSENLSGPDRKLVTELVYGTLRWRMKLDYALQACSNRPLQKIEPVLLRILRIAAYQILFLDRIPDWAIVDQAGLLGKVMRGSKAAGFLNGVLRKLTASRNEIEWPQPSKDPITALAITHSFPDWMVSDWVNRFGLERSDRLMQAFNQPPGLWIRTNTCSVDTRQLIKTLKDAGYSASASEILPDALVVKSDGAIENLIAGMQEGFHVQDGAAQAVCALLAPQPGHKILDCCSAPGGKTATLAQLMQARGSILSVDIHSRRLNLAKQLTNRLNLGCVEYVTHDLTKPLPPEWGDFDAIMLDAPCSSLGTIRRHPERKWNASKKNIDDLVRIQKALLNSVSRVMRPNAALVYSVCTLSREEGPDLIDQWLTQHPEFVRDDPRKHAEQSWHGLLNHEGALQTWPDRDNLDAFFAVRLVKRK